MPAGINKAASKIRPSRVNGLMRLEIMGSS
jgi:hypothetical protein